MFFGGDFFCGLQIFFVNLRINKYNTGYGRREAKRDKIHITNYGFWL